MGMNIETGDFRQIDPLIESLRDGEVMVWGTDEEMVELSRRVRLGAAELDKRKKRRKAQKQSRKLNR